MRGLCLVVAALGAASCAQLADVDQSFVAEVDTCAEALAMGGVPRAGLPAAATYDAVYGCACGPAAGACKDACADALCVGAPPDATCTPCLAEHCAAKLSACDQR